MSVQILEKVMMGSGGQYLKVQVSDHKALLDYKFTADDVVDAMPLPEATEEEKQAIKGVCVNMGYTFVDTFVEEKKDATNKGAVSSKEPASKEPAKEGDKK